jgi:hypothetical protein
MVENEFGDALDGGVAVQNVDGLAELLERLHQGIIMPQQHLVIELFVDPSLHDTLDVAEVADHVAIVERARSNLNLGDGVMAVRMPANAVVVEQPMAVTEIDALGHGIHTIVDLTGSVPDSIRRSKTRTQKPTESRALRFG